MRGLTARAAIALFHGHIEPTTDKGAATHPKRAVPGHRLALRGASKAVKAFTGATTRPPRSESDRNGFFARDCLAYACAHARIEIDR